jgi:hypothetical protein
VVERIRVLETLREATVTTVVASVFSEFLIDDAVLPTVAIKDLPTRRETVAVVPAAALIVLILTDVVAIEAIVVATADNVRIGCFMTLGAVTATAFRTFVPERVSVATVVPIPASTFPGLRMTVTDDVAVPLRNLCGVLRITGLAVIVGVNVLDGCLTTLGLLTIAVGTRFLAGACTILDEPTTTGASLFVG